MISCILNFFKFLPTETLLFCVCVYVFVFPELLISCLFMYGSILLVLEMQRSARQIRQRVDRMLGLLSLQEVIITSCNGCLSTTWFRIHNDIISLGGRHPAAKGKE